MSPIEILLLALGLVITAVGVVIWRRAARVLPPQAARPALEAPAPEPEPAPVPEPAPEPEPEPAPEPELAPVPVPAPEPEPEPEPPPAPAVPPLPRFAPPPAVVAVPLPVEKPRAEPSPEQLRREERRRYREGLAQTRQGFVARLARLFRGKPKVDASLLDEIEEVLFTADIGAKTAQKLMSRIGEVLDRQSVTDAEVVWGVIRNAALQIFDEVERAHPRPPPHPGPGPRVLLMIGVNGVGKTTTLGKLAARERAAGRRVLLVAGDTFRAAAGEQLDVWARRVGCEIHLGKDGSDPSSVIFDGISRGAKEGYDVILCDTAGRLHTRKELMDELRKIGRAAAKAIARAAGESADGGREPDDVLLCLDATIGQNALAQAQLFKETVGLSGLVLTKLDGTAKGGVVLGVCDEMQVPVRHIGIGERVDDLRDFDAEAFCDALFARPEGGGGEAEE
jgi:fused signal recognition particle receptor